MTDHHVVAVVAGMWGTAVVLGAMALVDCTGLWTPVDSARVAEDTRAQLACVDEAGTRAEAHACRCAVMARYPEGPQCDGGVP